MKALVRIGTVVLAIAAVVTVGLWYLTDPDLGKLVSAGRTTRPEIPNNALRSDPRIPLFSDNFVDDSGYDLAFKYTPPIPDRGSLALCYQAAGARAQRGIAEVMPLLDKLARATPRPPDYAHRRAMLQMFVGLLHMYDGHFDLASSWFEKAVNENPDIPRELRANLVALRGVAALRKGEIENCVACLGPSSCIFPLDPQAVHLRTEGSREAIRLFTRYLDERSDDLGVRWLLNIAHMTLGEYPSKIPPYARISLDTFQSKVDIGRFVNVAPTSGLDARGPNMLGGSVFDDFTGDGRPDVLVLSGDWDLGGSLFVNLGDGKYEDRGSASGLADQKMSVNLAHADFDNDGNLDVVALRGGWETPYRLSLLRNKGGGAFEDVTVAAGMAEPIASQSAAWGDFDNDGKLDLYVAGEYHDRNATSQNLGRLYHNRGDGTFENVAASAGVDNAAWAKGVVWGDYDDDGDIDLYVSNMNGPNRLYRNNGDGTFTDVAPDLGLTEPSRSFSCWFWDYDNDGKLDLFVTGFGASLLDIVNDSLRRPANGERPRLYHNNGDGTFTDVASQTGLDRVTLPMGSNFADIDNDGYLDVYLATGRPPYSILVPNLMFKNVGGARFEDITTSSGTGHLQKGHGVSFADDDGDGDLDLFVEVGGQTPGDKAHNVLFRNPGQGNHWLKLKLVGTRSNRSAIGAKVRAEVVGPGGARRTIHRVVNGGSSFGGNSLVATIGLGDATAVKSLTITWPVGKTVQTFQDVPGDRAIEIVEGTTSYRNLSR